MSPSKQPRWVLYARKFIATDNLDYLEQAKSACSDRVIVDFLNNPKSVQGFIDSNIWGPLSVSLHDAGRDVESICVKLLGLRFLAMFLDIAEDLDDKSKETAYKACDTGACLSRDRGFTECEAVFARTLGTYYAKSHQWEDASGLLHHTLILYRKLAKAEPRLYRPDLAKTLINLGNVQHRQRLFKAAQASYNEAIKLCRCLVKTDSHIHRPDLATTLNNLGNVLADLHSFDKAQEVLEEALDIRHDLANNNPDVYRPHLAATLNSLGIVLQGQHYFDKASSAYQEALVIRRDLTKVKPSLYLPHLAETLNNLGYVLCEQLAYAKARTALQEALDIRRDLAKVKPRIYLPYVARTLHNLGSVQDGQRAYAEAAVSYRKALKIRRDLVKVEPHIHLSDLARTLNNLGNTLCHQNSFAEARNAFQEALHIRRLLAKDEPHIYGIDIAATLHNLSNVLSKLSVYDKARVACQEAVDICRNLAAAEPHIYTPNVAMTILSLGGILSEQGSLVEASNAYQEAIGLYDRLSETEPQIYQPCIALAKNNLSIVFEKLHQDDIALEMSRQAIEAAESSDISIDQRWLAKGNASSAYLRWLRRCVHDKKDDAVIRCLSALREGQVCALGKDHDEGLIALQSIHPHKPIHVLVVQGVSKDETVICVARLGDKRSPIQYMCDDKFAFSAKELFDELITVFNVHDTRSNDQRYKKIEKLAQSAWESLPGFVKKTLDPKAAHSVLISGDRYWSAFPWELLPCNDTEYSWLGLHRVLARWGSLTTASLSRLQPTTFGQSQTTAAVFCPWDATSNPKKHLQDAKCEAETVANMLRKMEYQLIPGGRATSGIEANIQTFENVLSDSASVIHYTGHGDIIDNEEVLILHGGHASMSGLIFGRKELNNLKQRLNKNRLLDHQPLIVLNSCMTGATRDFGGQREDLAATLQAEGAESVIASCLPVYDQLGRLFGEVLYTPGFMSEEGMGRTLVYVRRLVEWEARQKGWGSWITWALLTYHGNPFAHLPNPHKTSTTKKKKFGSFVSTPASVMSGIAGMLHLKDLGEVEALVRKIRQ